ncbi:MAG: hypothetical protein HYY06_09110 [Deltaproteobacteria bacterium]|nr:hypothetical protein [Deltaproteobacteria bacterium]
MTKRRLERIIQVKERIRGVRRSELETADEELARAAEAASEAGKIHDGAIGSLTRAGQITAEDLARQAAVVALAAKVATEANGTLEVRKVEREERAATVFDATRDVRALEILHQRMGRAEQKEERKKEQGATDEAAGRMVRVVR